MPNLIRHECTRPSSDPTFSPEWSGVTGAPHCFRGCVCSCGEELHLEDGNHYCPRCDDYVRPANNPRCYGDQ